MNHLEAHALTPGLTHGLRFPYLLLLVSGGHTQLLIVKDVGQYTRLGTTLDDALGEAFDKAAKLLGLDYPGGPAVEEAAKRGRATIALPRPMHGRPEPHFSLAGLKTALRHEAMKRAPLSDQDVADLCASFQEAAADVVSDRTRRAMELYADALGDDAQKALVVAGGVAANQRLRAALAEVAAEQGFTLILPPLDLCTDNAAMVAWAGAERLARGLVDDLAAPSRARWPLDPGRGTGARRRRQGLSKSRISAHAAMTAAASFLYDRRQHRLAAGTWLCKAWVLSGEAPGARRLA